MTSPTTDQAAANSRLRSGDVLRVGASGLRARKLRTALSALGVSIGIAAMVGVLGLSESSKSALLDEISALGTNLLTVEASSGFGGGDRALPPESVQRLGNVDTVEAVAASYTVDTDVFRNEFIDPGETGGVTVVAADESLLDTLNGELATGRWLDESTSRYPTVVLGSVAADRLGVDELGEPAFVYIGDEYVEVIGILEEFPLSADLDRSVIMGQPAAASFYEADDSPTTIYARVNDGTIDETRDLVPATVDPESPEEVAVSRPSDALEAQAAADDTLTTLFLGLGAVALLVGGIGIANVMVIAVIERRGEIGLRCALGATRAHIRRQFLTEAVILSTLGGAAGVALGIGATYLYSAVQGWRVIIPVTAAAGGFAAALIIGAIAGLYPAIRAARLAPTEALRS
jgi:putative ABC transport system permease protein